MLCLSHPLHVNVIHCAGHVWPTPWTGLSSPTLQHTQNITPWTGLSLPTLQHTQNITPWTGLSLPTLQHAQNITPWTGLSLPMYMYFYVYMFVVHVVYLPLLCVVLWTL